MGPWAFSDVRYWYLGYEMQTEEEGLAFIQAYRDTVKATGKPPTEDLIQLRTSTGKISEKLARFGTKEHESLDTARVTPFIIERPGYLRGGSNVVYMDGHTEFIPYPGKWPMTEKFIRALESLDALKESHADTAEK